MAESDEEVRALPASLWARLRADPSRAPEHLALAAAERHAPAAREWVQERTARYAVSPNELGAGPDSTHLESRHGRNLRRQLTERQRHGELGFRTLQPDLLQYRPKTGRQIRRPHPP